jgi:hypothetical protein
MKSPDEISSGLFYILGAKENSKKNAIGRSDRPNPQLIPPQYQLLADFIATRPMAFTTI